MEVPSLHPDTIKEVKAKADIYEVVSSYVVLKKQGKDYQGLCPFHQERSPSFTVSPGKQMYYCFGCQAGGGAVNFLMEINKQSFAEVILDLARQYQVSIKTLAPEKRQELQRQLTEREQLGEIMAVAANFYHHALSQPQGQAALSYLQDQRQLTADTIKDFQLGYSPATWDTLCQYLTVTKKFPVKLVEAAGLIVPRRATQAPEGTSGEREALKRASGHYDRFRNRLMIPIWDINGRVIAFGGRSLGDEQPKYLNSPETPLFDKGKTLYGLNLAKDTIKKEDRVVVVEGFFDVIALHAAGITNAVASLGTALNNYQIKQLLRFTDSKQIVFNFDADKAGTLATARAIEEVANLAYQGQVQLRVLNLPAGKDADEFLKENSSDLYSERLANAPLWLDWQLEKAIVDRDLQDARFYQQAMADSINLLLKITDTNARSFYLQKAAQLLSGSDVRQIPLLVENLNTELKRKQREVKPTKSSYQPPATRGTPESDFTFTAEDFAAPDDEAINNDTLVPARLSPQQRLVEQAEAVLLRLYLHYPEHRLTIIDTLDQADLIFSLPHHRFIWQKILEVGELGAIDYLDPNLIGHLQDLYGSHRSEMAQISHLFNLDERTAQEIQRSTLVIRAAGACLEKAACEQQRSYYLAQWQSPEMSPERKQECYELFYEAQRKLESIEQQRLFTMTDLIGCG
jgi:DNA primase